MTNYANALPYIAWIYLNVDSVPVWNIAEWSLQKYLNYIYSIWTNHLITLIILKYVIRTWYLMLCNSSNMQSEILVILFPVWQMQINISLLLSMYLTHWGRDKMGAISQTTSSSAFSWMKMFEFRLKFQWSLFLRVQLTIFQHWFR